MIAIVNRGDGGKGVCEYTIGINDTVLATFRHDRRDGLAKCLRLAADAAEQRIHGDIANIVQSLDEEMNGR
jgi:hypothetical protein